MHSYMDSTEHREPTAEFYPGLLGDIPPTHPTPKIPSTDNFLHWALSLLLQPSQPSPSPARLGVWIRHWSTEQKHAHFTRIIVLVANRNGRKYSISKSLYRFRRRRQQRRKSKTPIAVLPKGGQLGYYRACIRHSTGFIVRGTRIGTSIYLYYRKVSYRHEAEVYDPVGLFRHLDIRRIWISGVQNNDWRIYSCPWMSSQIESVYVTAFFVQYFQNLSNQ